MPTVRVELEDPDIRTELKKLGYGFQLDRRYPIWLTVADTSQPKRGIHYRRKPLSPISEAKYARIRKFAETAKQAAMQIVELSHGRLTDPDLPQERGEVSGGSIDADTLKSVVASAVANEVENVTAPLRREIAARDQQLEDLRRQNEGLRARAAKLLKQPKGKKGKKAPAAALDDDFDDVPVAVAAPLDPASAADIG